MNGLEQAIFDRFHAEITGITYRMGLEIEAVCRELKAPSTIYHPRLFLDGDQWCALYGDDLQAGVAGFGATPSLAMGAFDLAWCTPLKLKEPAV